VAKARLVRPPIVVLLFFLVAHAWIAFGFKPDMSDTPVPGRCAGEVGRCREVPGT
jgi:hypothetical protein